MNSNLLHRGARFERSARLVGGFQGESVIPTQFFPGDPVGLLGDDDAVFTRRGQGRFDGVGQFAVVHFVQAGVANVVREDQSDNAIGILFPDAPQGPSVFILKIRICFSGADESKITHCVSASASNVAKAMVDRSDFALRAWGFALRATTPQDDGTRRRDKLARYIEASIKRKH
jgi:hypothetical protein